MISCDEPVKSGSDADDLAFGGIYCWPCVSSWLGRRGWLILDQSGEENAHIDDDVDFSPYI